MLKNWTQAAKAFIASLPRKWKEFCENGKPIPRAETLDDLNLPLIDILGLILLVVLLGITIP